LDFRAILEMDRLQVATHTVSNLHLVNRFQATGINIPLHYRANHRVIESDVGRRRPFGVIILLNAATQAQQYNKLNSSKSKYLVHQE
jgi:hypothetical protein